MAKLGEEYSHITLSIQPFFRLPTTKSEDNSFLVNEGKKTVLKIKEKKVIHSWTLTHPNAFTCPVITNDDGELYCIQNSNTLLKWSLEDETIKNASAFKSKESMFAVLPVSGKMPVVIFQSGNALSTEALPSMQHLKQKVISNEEQIIWANASNFQSKTYIVFLSKVNTKKKRENTKCYTLHSYVLNENSISDYSSEVVHRESEELKSWCFDESTLRFCTLWSNGLIQTYQITSKEQSTLITIDEVQDSQLFDMDYIDPNHLALVRCNPELKEVVLEIWDVLFMFLKEKKKLKSASVSSIQLSVIDSTIFLSYNEELLELNFFVEKSTLATAAGKTITHGSYKKLFWNKGKITENTDDEIKIEKMDTSEKEQVKNPTELIAQKLMEEGSSYLKYISDPDLVKLLRLAVRHKLNKKDDDSNIDPDAILASIFTSPCSDISFVKLMKSLNTEEALVTLEILLSLLQDKKSLSSASDALKITNLQIFNWIVLVIQSHMETILLSQDKRCEKILKKLNKLLLEKMDEYEDYASMQSMILAGEKKILPEKYVDSRYCTEFLET